MSNVQKLLQLTKYITHIKLNKCNKNCYNRFKYVIKIITPYQAGIAFQSIYSVYILERGRLTGDGAGLSLT